MSERQDRASDMFQRKKSNFRCFQRQICRKMILREFDENFWGKFRQQTIENLQSLQASARSKHERVRGY